MPDIRLKLLGTPAAPSASDPVAGVIWITISMALFAGLAVFSRQAMNAGLHPFEVVFLRNTFACLLLVPLLVYRGRSLLRSERSASTACASSSRCCRCRPGSTPSPSFRSARSPPSATWRPLFGTLGAVFLLGEVVRIRRWTALGVGFLGAMIILRPSGLGRWAMGQLCALVSAMSGGLTAVLVKQLTARDDPDKIVFLTNAMLLPLSLVPALFVWRWPTLAVLPALIGMGLCAVLGHVSVVRGYAATDASLAMTFEFSKLPFAVGIAYLAFGEVIDAWTWIGALIIFASAVYITRREAKLRAQRASTRAQAPATRRRAATREPAAAPPRCSW